MTTLCIANNRTEEMVGDLTGMTPSEQLLAGCGAQRMLWWARDGDVLVLPGSPDPEYLAYVTGLTGARADSLTFVVPPPGERGDQVLTADRLADPGFRAELRRVLAGRSVAEVLAISPNAAVAELAAALGLAHAMPGLPFAAQGGNALVNSKAGFRALAAGAGVPIPPGTVAGSPAEVEAAVEHLLAQGHSVMVKVEYQAGGLGNEILARDERVEAVGAERVVPLPDRAAVAAYVAERWTWLTGGRGQRVVVERYFADSAPLYAQFLLDDAAVVPAGCGEMLMRPVVAGEITPPVTPDADVTAELVRQGARLCEALRAIGYRGTVSADAVLTPKGEIYFHETNARLTGSSHLHDVYLGRLLREEHRGSRFLLELGGLRVPSFAEALAAVGAAGLAFDPRTGTGVLFSSDFGPADGSVMYCAVAESPEAARALEAALLALFAGTEPEADEAADEAVDEGAAAAAGSRMRALVIHRYGGPEELRIATVPQPVAAPGRVLVDVTLAGLNYADLEIRAGEYLQLPLPAVLGVDVVGRRRADGKRVVALLRTGGGYAEVAAPEAAHTVEVPDGVDDAQALALLEQGATAYGALTLAGRLRAGETVAVTAAAGGVGHLAVQLARALGAGRVVALASTPEKREFLRSLGADLVLDPEDPELAGRLAESGGVDLFLDSVGGPVLRAGLAGLAPFGRLVSVGAREGVVDTFTMTELTEGSAGAQGFWLKHVLTDRALFEGIADHLFRLAVEGRVVARIDRTVPLSGVAAAHRAMAARQTVGKVLVDVHREA
ncbi:zinc-binding dehydrogenase [Kitasatospora sp. NPDC001547]|uniref:preATP grasp domain-containing protein n=1 Tax=Kitasatospora sp. NPDC001547 TaxID=3364015 RepID=UPI00369484DF